MSITITLEGLEDVVRAWDTRALPALRSGLAAAVKGAIHAGADVAKSHVHSVTGNLASNIRDEMTRESMTGDEVEGAIEANTNYASFVEEGTRPHDIRPKNAQALRWVGPGGIHFAKVVHHPGSKSKPFMGPAYIAAEQRLERDAELALQAAIAAME